LDVFDIKPDYDLSIMKEHQTLFDITTSVMLQIKDVFMDVRPDIVLVHGDTTTSFSAALAAFYLQIPVGHVEAGLRTYRIDSPFPEEFNRQAVGVISAIHFAPTEQAKINLIREGKNTEDIFVTGNTGIDALRTTVRPDYQHEDLAWAAGSRLVLMTAHRRENLGEPMRRMFRAIRRIVDMFSDVKVLYPVHLNPQVRQVAEEVLGEHPRIRLIRPLDAFDFHNFMAASFLILTDSGGIQEEAPALGKPVLVMRDTTERPEGIRAGTLKLVGSDEKAIIDTCSKLLSDSSEYALMSKAINPYGDGHASERIVKILKRNLSL